MLIESRASAPVAAVNHRYPALDGLRGAAAFAVLFYHLRNLHAADAPAWAGSVFASGYLAVDLFFVLSGFVIAHAYGARLGASMGFRQFLQVRIIRLQPVVAIGTLIGFSVALSGRLLGFPDAPGLLAIVTSLPANLMMLPNVLVPWGIFLFNPPAWSLFYELIANGAYAAVMCRRQRTAAHYRAASHLVLFVITLAGLIGVVVSAAMLGDLDRGVVLGDWPVALARITFSFTIGLLLHRTRDRWLTKTPELAMPWLLAACLILLAPDVSSGARAIYDIAFVTLASPVLVMLAARSRLPGRWADWATWLGIVSYPLYAVHAPIKHLIETFFPTTFLSMLALSAGISVLLAIAVGFVIDPALRGWISSRRRSQAQPRDLLPLRDNA